MVYLDGKLVTLRILPCMKCMSETSLKTNVEINVLPNWSRVTLTFLNYLGYRTSIEGVQMDPANVQSFFIIGTLAHLAPLK